MMVEHDYKNFPELTNTQLETMGFTSPHEQITQDFFADVIKVHDGDTVTLRTDFRDFDFPLRLLGIDAPELNTGAPGAESRDWLKERIEGQNVEIRIDPTNRVGKYGRLLGKIFMTGLDVGDEMLMWGLVLPFSRRRESMVPATSEVLKSQWF